MTQPPSAEAFKAAWELHNWMVDCRHPETHERVARLLHSFAQQRVKTETQRWQTRDRQRLEQIGRLQETVQSFQIARDERPAPEPVHLTLREQGVMTRALLRSTRPAPARTNFAPIDRTDEWDFEHARERPAPAPHDLASTGEQPASPAALMDYTERAREEAWFAFLARKYTQQSDARGGRCGMRVAHILRDAPKGTRLFARQGWWGVASWTSAAVAAGWGGYGCIWVGVFAALAGLSMGRVSWGATPAGKGETG